MNIRNELIGHISETNDIKKLELTITTLLFGWVMDEENRKDYVELIEVSVNRLNILCLLSGEQHPLCKVDIERDGKKIETYVMMSIVKGMMKSEEQKMTMLEGLSMN